MPLTFNRTSMELKRLFPKPQSLRITAFNRTSMELKLRLKHLRCQLRCTFNRTSMELKHTNETVATSICSALLIEPVWN